MSYLIGLGTRHRLCYAAGYVAMLVLATVARILLNASSAAVPNPDAHSWACCDNGYSVGGFIQT
jgi:hypothetical protein